MAIHYLEIVTREIDATCAAYSAVVGEPFSDSVAELGNARIAATDSGTLIGVRAPMHDQEMPVARPYGLVADIEAALTAATAAGGEVALPATPIPGRGQCAIYFLDGIQHGLWQL